MKSIINDFTTHPLVPGCVLGSVIGDPKAREAQLLDETALRSLNKMAVVEIVGYFQNVRLLSTEPAGKILAADNDFIAAYKILSPRITEVAQVAGWAAAATAAIAWPTVATKLPATTLCSSSGRQMKIFPFTLSSVTSPN